MIACSVFFQLALNIRKYFELLILKISQQTTKQNANLESSKRQVAKAQMRLHDERLTWTF